MKNGEMLHETPAAEPHTSPGPLLSSNRISLFSFITSPLPCLPQPLTFQKGPYDFFCRVCVYVCKSHLQINACSLPLPLNHDRYPSLFTSPASFLPSSFSFYAKILVPHFLRRPCAWAHARALPHFDIAIFASFRLYTARPPPLVPNARATGCALLAELVCHGRWHVS